jgi:hypothetical protein
VFEEQILQVEFVPVPHCTIKQQEGVEPPPPPPPFTLN